MRIGKILLVTWLAISLTHCFSYDFSRKYVQEGNLLPKEKISRLRIGMNREDVAILMGTSLLSPSFNNDRWDYAYTSRHGRKKTEVYNLSLYFTHDRLSKIEHQP